MKKYRIIYQFRHSKMGFQNSVTIFALTLDQAMKDAEKAVSEVYGSKMLNRFTFKPDPIECGMVVK